MATYPWTINVQNKLGWTKASQSGAYCRARWLKIRDYMLSKEPLCSECKKNGKVVSAIIVDHIEPIDGEKDPLFYDINNLQCLCQFHHGSKTRTDNSKHSEKNKKMGSDLMNLLES